jgi:hypothetical protein
VSAPDLVAVARCLEGSVDFITLTHAEQVEVRRELARRNRGAGARPGRQAGERSVPPADRPACEGHDPRMFTSTSRIAEGLKVCGPCLVKDWCLLQVRPHEGFDGVAGGIGWIRGRRVAPLRELKGGKK